MRYTIIGSAFDGNKGAASMLEAAIQGIVERDPDARFFLLSMYPQQDRQQNRHSAVEVINARPFRLGLVINSLALLYVLRPLRPLLRRCRAIQAIADSDVYIDQGGITFVDGREKFLLYNLASILPAIFIGVPVVKCSQAMGPFHSWLNRLAARACLPRLNAVFARGSVTRGFLDSLQLSNVSDAADLAFCLRPSDQDMSRVEALLMEQGVVRDERDRIIVLPSEVVRKKCHACGIDYVSEVTKFVECISGRVSVLLVPHSIRMHTNKSHNNDVPLVKEIAARLADRKGVSAFIRSVNAAEMRCLLSTADLIVTSRFHGMVSALASCVPVHVVGWSHKYKEVMDAFGIDGYASDSKDLSSSQLCSAFERLEADAEGVRQSIRNRLEGVTQSAAKQLDVIVDVAADRASR